MNSYSISDANMSICSSENNIILSSEKNFFTPACFSSLSSCVTQLYNETKILHNENADKKKYYDESNRNILHGLGGNMYDMNASCFAGSYKNNLMQNLTFNSLQNQYMNSLNFYEKNCGCADEQSTRINKNTSSTCILSSSYYNTSLSLVSSLVSRPVNSCNVGLGRVCEVHNNNSLIKNSNDNLNSNSTNNSTTNNFSFNNNYKNNNNNDNIINDYNIPEIIIEKTENLPMNDNSNNTSFNKSNQNIHIVSPHHSSISNSFSSASLFDFKQDSCVLSNEAMQYLSSSSPLSIRAHNVLPLTPTHLVFSPYSNIYNYYPEMTMKVCEEAENNIMDLGFEKSNEVILFSNANKNNINNININFPINCDSYQNKFILNNSNKTAANLSKKHSDTNMCEVVDLSACSLPLNEAPLHINYEVETGNITRFSDSVCTQNDYLPASYITCNSMPSSIYTYSSSPLDKHNYNSYEMNNYIHANNARNILKNNENKFSSLSLENNVVSSMTLQDSQILSKNEIGSNALDLNKNENVNCNNEQLNCLEDNNFHTQNDMQNKVDMLKDRNNSMSEMRKSAKFNDTFVEILQKNNNTTYCCSADEDNSHTSVESKNTEFSNSSSDPFLFSLLHSSFSYPSSSCFSEDTSLSSPLSSASCSFSSFNNNNVISTPDLTPYDKINPAVFFQKFSQKTFFITETSGSQLSSANFPLPFLYLPPVSSSAMQCNNNYVYSNKNELEMNQFNQNKVFNNSNNSTIDTQYSLGTPCNFNNYKNEQTEKDITSYNNYEKINSNSSNLNDTASINDALNYLQATKSNSHTNMCQSTPILNNNNVFFQGSSLISCDSTRNVDDKSNFTYCPSNTDNNCNTYCNNSVGTPSFLYSYSPTSFCSASSYSSSYATPHSLSLSYSNLSNMTFLTMKNFSWFRNESNSNTVASLQSIISPLNSLPSLSSLSPSAEKSKFGASNLAVDNCLIVQNQNYDLQSCVNSNIANCSYSYMNIYNNLLKKIFHFTENSGEVANSQKFNTNSISPTNFLLSACSFPSTCTLVSSSPSLSSHYSAVDNSSNCDGTLQNICNSIIESNRSYQGSANASFSEPLHLSFSDFQSSSPTIFNSSCSSCSSLFIPQQKSSHLTTSNNLIYSTEINNNSSTNLDQIKENNYTSFSGSSCISNYFLASRNSEKQNKDLVSYPEQMLLSSYQILSSCSSLSSSEHSSTIASCKDVYNVTSIKPEKNCNFSKSRTFQSTNDSNINDNNNTVQLNLFLPSLSSHLVSNNKTFYSQAFSRNYVSSEQNLSHLSVSANVSTDTSPSIYKSAFIQPSTKSFLSINTGLTSITETSTIFATGLSNCFSSYPSKFYGSSDSSLSAFSYSTPLNLFSPPPPSFNAFSLSSMTAKECFFEQEKLLSHAHVDSSHEDYKPCPPTDKIKCSPHHNKTTIMLKNLPTCICQTWLLENLKKRGFHGKFNFFYLPIDFHNKCNVGYCFINFIHPSFSLEFKHMYSGYDIYSDMYFDFYSNKESKNNNYYNNETAKKSEISHNHNLNVKDISCDSKFYKDKEENNSSAKQIINETAEDHYLEDQQKNADKEEELCKKGNNILSSPNEKSDYFYSKNNKSLLLFSNHAGMFPLAPPRVNTSPFMKDLCEVKYARVQGLVSNMLLYENSAVLKGPTDIYKPLLFKHGVRIEWAHKSDGSGVPHTFVRVMGKKKAGVTKEAKKLLVSCNNNTNLISSTNTLNKLIKNDMNDAVQEYSVIDNDHSCDINNISSISCSNSCTNKNSHNYNRNNSSNNINKNHSIYEKNHNKFNHYGNSSYQKNYFNGNYENSNNENNANNENYKINENNNKNENKLEENNYLEKSKNLEESNFLNKNTSSILLDNESQCSSELSLSVKKKKSLSCSNLLFIDNPSNKLNCSNKKYSTKSNLNNCQIEGYETGEQRNYEIKNVLNNENFKSRNNDSNEVDASNFVDINQNEKNQRNLNCAIMLNVNKNVYKKESQENQNYYQKAKTIQKKQSSFLENKIKLELKQGKNIDNSKTEKKVSHWVESQNQKMNLYEFHNNNYRLNKNIHNNNKSKKDSNYDYASNVGYYFVDFVSNKTNSNGAHKNKILNYNNQSICATTVGADTVANSCACEQEDENGNIRNQNLYHARLKVFTSNRDVKNNDNFTNEQPNSQLVMKCNNSSNASVTKKTKAM